VGELGRLRNCRLAPPCSEIGDPWVGLPDVLESAVPLGVGKVATRGQPLRMLPSTAYGETYQKTRPPERG